VIGSPARGFKLILNPATNTRWVLHFRPQKKILTAQFPIVKELKIPSRVGLYTPVMPDVVQSLYLIFWDYGKDPDQKMVLTFSIGMV
jgi:hypothetical protein